ncbi:MAG: hypothetical protein QOH03_1271 [Kribbellaceae bacterium]|jgi:hypothetical protein|nr:hypothetical protein [Kribbellaceae bacterium]
MTAIVPIEAESIDGYGAPDRPWSQVQACLDQEKGGCVAPGVQDGQFYAPFSAPSAGPQPWNLHLMTVTTVFGVEEPHSAMRWRF